MVWAHRVSHKSEKGCQYSSVPDRVTRHNEGASKWTKGKGPWTVVWTSEAKSLSDARKFENILMKKQKGGSGFFRLTGLARSSGS